MAQVAPSAAPNKAEAMRRAFEEERQRQCDRLTAEIRRRAKLRAACLQEEKVRRVALNLCEEDPVRFIDDWVWTYDPRNVGQPLPPWLPFVLRPKQRELIRWLEERETTETGGIVEKSREEGMSYIVLAFMLHHWLFRPGYAAGLGSHKAPKVDQKDDPDSLFEKLRIMLGRLPNWMQPEGFDKREHDNYMRLINPENDSTITGDCGDEIGRGGRKTLYFVDEWAIVPNARSVNASLSQNSHVVIKGGTPKGVGNQLYEDRHSGRYAVFTLHWRDNPAKNYTASYVDESGELQEIYPWYEKECQENDELTIAQEIDIAYGASAEGIVIKSKWVQAAIDFPLEPGSVTTAGLDVAGSGRDKDVYTSRKGGKLLRIEEIMGKNPKTKAETVKQNGKVDGIERIFYDRLGVGEGMTATLKADEEKLPFDVVGIANSQSPTKRKFEDQPDVPCDERFFNYAAELWWALRIRFWKTWQRAEGIKMHPDDECISIPHNQVLVAQLSQPTYTKNSADKIKVDKKGNGTKSPDHAESCMYAFAHKKENGNWIGW